jgi:hypothetical protein
VGHSGLPKCKTAARAAVQEMLTENQGQTTISHAPCEPCVVKKNVVCP